MRTIVAAVAVSVMLIGCASPRSGGEAAAAAARPAGERPLAVFVIGTHHYRAHESMPPLARELEQRYGWRVKVVATDYDPEHNEKGLPGLEALKDADVAVLFMRFLTLPPSQLAQLTRYIGSGKPIVALRTTTHAFDYEITDARRRRWNDFGREVLGSAYSAHVGSYTDVTIAPPGRSHPILTGIPRQTTRLPSQLYKAQIPADATPLLIGSTASDKRLQVGQFGWHWFDETSTYPIAWTWRTPRGNRVFTTTLGSPEDLQHPLTRRLFFNALHWAVGLPMPGE